MEKMYLDKIAKKKPKSFMLENADCVLHCFIPSNEFIHP